MGKPISSNLYIILFTFDLCENNGPPSSKIYLKPIKDFTSTESEKLFFIIMS
jgi:hypothetical protein